METTIKLNNVTLFWCKHNTLDEYSGKYQVDLSGLNSKQSDRLSEMGLNVKNKNDDRNDFISVRSKFPLNIYDKDGTPLTEVAIGNGSKATVYATVVPYKVGPNSGFTMRLKKMYVDDLVEYNKEDTVPDVDEEL